VTPNKHSLLRAPHNLRELSTPAFTWPRVAVSKRLHAVRWGEPPKGREKAALAKQGLVWADYGSTGLRPYIRFNHRLLDRYEVRAAYDQAEKKRNPQLSPHTALRRAWNKREVLNFLSEFGPLLQDPPHTVPANLIDEKWDRADVAIPRMIDLRDFERRQSCYSVVLRLYDALHDSERLKREWRDAVGKIAELESGGFPPIRCYISYDTDEEEPIWSVASRSPGNPSDSSFPAVGRLEFEGFPDWIEKAAFDDLRWLAHQVIVRAVEEHASNRVGWLVGGDEVGRPKFRPTATPPSLWAAIWSFFAADTERSVLWRLCPHCAKLFIPPRRDRYYCTSRLQQLYSKRKWARENRGLGEHNR
jgi:hypothetical protein